MSASVPLKIKNAVKARSDSVCEAGSVVCTKRAHHFHHRRLRSQGGLDTVENLLHVCGPCHEFMHRNRSEARERGWILHRGDAA